MRTITYIFAANGSSRRKVAKPPNLLYATHAARTLWRVPTHYSAGLLDTVGSFTMRLRQSAIRKFRSLAESRSSWCL